MLYNLLLGHDMVFNDYFFRRLFVVNMNDLCLLISQLPLIFEILKSMGSSLHLHGLKLIFFLCSHHFIKGLFLLNITLNIFHSFLRLMMFFKSILHPRNAVKYLFSRFILFLFMLLNPVLKFLNFSDWVVCFLKLFWYPWYSFWCCAVLKVIVTTNRNMSTLAQPNIPLECYSKEEKHFWYTIFHLIYL